MAILALSRERLGFSLASSPDSRESDDSGIAIGSRTAFFTVCGIIPFFVLNSSWIARLLIVSSSAFFMLSVMVSA